MISIKNIRNQKINLSTLDSFFSPFLSNEIEIFSENNRKIPLFKQFC